MRIDRNRGWILAGLCALSLLSPLAAWAQSGTVEEIIVIGLSRMGQRPFLHAFGIAEGDPYDVQKVRTQFRRLWDLGLFEDITIETEIGPNGGNILFIKVKERPVLSSVTYEDNQVVTKTQIEDRFKEKSISLGVGKPLDLGQVFFAESAIRDMFGEKGFLDATVNAEVQRVTETSRALYFTMIPGGKTRIRHISFTGNEVFKDRKLKSRLKLTQERKWYWPWSAKNLYHPIKWDQDVAGISELYKNSGYIDVEIKAPVVEVRRKKGGEKKEEAEPQPEPGPVILPEPPLIDDTMSPKRIAKLQEKHKKAVAKARKKARKKRTKKSKRWVYLTVPITDGPQYTLGEITLTGNEVYSDHALRLQVPVSDGAVFNDGALQFGVDRITRLYEDRGYLYSAVVRKVQRREGEAVADVEITINEDEPYYVALIEFQGNSATHDRVLRRELQLMEGELFSRTKLDFSRRKINQLGYFQVIAEPLIEPIAGENRVKITMPGQEQGRNEIQVGGGFSGLEGAFFNGIYSTRNFLGRGQVLSTALQIGGRSSRYQISFQEPWFLGRPYLFGVSLFRRDTDFGSNLRSTSTGGGIVLGRQVSRFARLNIGYNYEEVTSTSFTTGTSVDDGTGILTSENKISSVTPIFVYSTVNNPFRPTSGMSFDVRVQIAGGALGGNTSFIKPLTNLTIYRRVLGRTFIAVHGEAGMIAEFGSPEPGSVTSNIGGVPRFQRFWLGGDTLGPRVFETRTITPRRFVKVVDGVIVDVTGNIVGQPPTDFINIGGVPVPIEVGGDRMYLLQTEYVIPLNEQTDMAFFVDFGDALFEDTSLDFTTTRISAGLELRFNLPIFPVPLRLIYGVPVRELDRDRTSSFTFSIGRSF